MSESLLCPRAKKTVTQAWLISKIFVTIWSARKFAVAFKGTSSITQPRTLSSGNTVLLETTDMSKHKAEILPLKIFAVYCNFIAT